MDLRQFIAMLDELFQVPEEAPEPMTIHEIEVEYTLADPEPQLGWS